MSSADCAEPADCERALDELQEYLDGEMPDGRLEEISGHLAACYPCADRKDFEAQLRSIVRRDCVESAPSGLRERIQQSTPPPTGNRPSAAVLRPAVPVQPRPAAAPSRAMQQPSQGQRNSRSDRMIERARISRQEE